MKKKPELFKGTGKSSLTLRNFLNNLKENDLHYENKQITQCVFLGVLRLKPVPSIFNSNNVPSVSAPSNEIAPKASKSEVKASSSNKKVIKNLPKKQDINKGNGKVSKKNPQTVKAAVKKVPVKKSDILKIKLNGKKKVVKNKDTISPINSEEQALSLPSDVPPTIAPHAFLSAPTITLTPIISNTAFNPVQNLFDKLKQKIDEKNSEPSTSKIKKQTHKAKDVPEGNATFSKVCKINAKRPAKIVSVKKAKQLLHKKPGLYEGLHLVSTKTPSPITISDTESTSKKDEDDITIITDDSNSSSSFNQEVVPPTETRDSATEDIIFVNQDTKQKNKTRTSPRHKIVEGDAIAKQSIAVTQIGAKPGNNSTPLVPPADDQIRESTQSNEVIVISEDSAIKENPGDSEKRQNPDEANTSRNEVIVIDEVRGTRVSPRLKKVEETKQKNKDQEKSDSDIIVIGEELTTPKINVPSTDFQGPSIPSNTSNQLNVAVDTDQIPREQTKTSLKRLKVVANPERNTITIKRELIEAVSDVTVLTEKPKQKRSKPPLLPPALLTPMLLRSELAPKKSNASPAFGKSRTSREKSSQRLLRSDLEQTKSAKKTSKSPIYSSTRLLRSELQNLKNTQSPVGNNSPSVEDTQDPQASFCYVPPPQQSSDTTSLPYTNISAEETYTSQDFKVEEKSFKLDDFPPKEEDILNETKLPRLLRSDFAKPKSVENSPSDIKEDVSAKKENVDILLGEPESLPTEVLMPEIITELNITDSELNESATKQDLKTFKQPEDDVIFVNDESLSKANTSSRCLRSDISQAKKINTDIEETVVISENAISTQKDKSSSKITPEVSQQKPRVSQKSDVIDVDKIVIVNDQTLKKSRDRSNGRLLRSELAQQNAKQRSPPKMDAEKIVVVQDEPKPKEKRPQSSDIQSDVSSIVGVQETRTSKNDRSPPRSSRTDRQMQSSDSLPSEVKAIIDDFTRDEPVVVKHTTSSRLLRSEIVSQQSQATPNHDNSVPFRLSGSEMTEKIPQKVSSSLSSVAIEENQTSIRILRSETASTQKSPEPQTPSEVSSVKASTQTPEHTSISSNKVCLSIEIVEDGDIEQVTSYQMLPPEVSPQKKSNKHSNVQRAQSNEEKETSRLLRSEASQSFSNRHSENYEIMDNKAKEKYPYRRRRSLLMDLKLKQKTSMLLRSELAQMKTGSTSSSITETVQDTPNKEVNVPSITIEVQPVMMESSEQTPKISSMPSPRRKSLIDDLKKKKTSKEHENIVPILNVADQNINTDISQQTSAFDCNIQNKSDNVTIVDTNKAEEVPKRKRSPRITKLQNDDQKDSIDHSHITFLETKVEPVEAVSTEIPKEAKESEKKTDEKVDTSPDKVPQDIPSIEKKSTDLINSEVNEIPEILSLQKSPKQLSSNKSSPKVVDSKKLSPKEKTSPKRKSKETLPDEGINVNETTIQTVLETNEQQENLIEVNQATPRKQKKSPTQRASRQVKNEANDVLESQDPPQGSVGEENETNTSPKRKSSPKRKGKKISFDQEKSQEEPVESNKVDNKLVSPKSSPSKQKQSMKSVEKALEPASDPPESGVLTEKAEVLKPKVNKSKQNKLKKTTLKVKSKAKTVRGGKPKVERRPTRITSTIPPKQKKQNKKTATDTKVIEENVSGDNVQTEKADESTVSPDIDAAKANEKKRVAPPSRAKKRKAKAVEKTVTEEVVNDVSIKLELEDGNKNSLITSIEPKTNVKKRQASPVKRRGKKPREQGVDVENVPQKETPNDVAAVTPEVTTKVQKPKQKRKTISAKIKSEQNDSAKEPDTPPEKIDAGSPKKMDTTVFDFDESEPEVVPLRLGSPRRNKVIQPIVAESIETTSTTKRQKGNRKSNTKAQAKTKLFNKSGGTEKASNESSQGKVFDPQTSPTKTSPLKQTTITDMFSKAQVKKERQTGDIFQKESAPSGSTEKNVITDMPPPKFEGKPPPPPPKDDGEENEYYEEEDDSDCDSRMEWIPEEYAEYKFKYSAKKMMTYKPIHKCKICLLILPSYYRLSKHKLEHAKKENPYCCTQCEQAFSSIEDLTAHLRLHKGKHPYTCKKCDIGFWSKKALDAHTPIHVLRKVKQPNKRFRCDVCAKEFSKLCDMERHTRVHTGEKPCVCNICNKRFQQSHNLSKHLLTHLHVKPFYCEICGKQFGRNDVLNRHLLTHSVEKPIKCSYCQKGFIRQSQLNNHMKKNHSGAVKEEVLAESVTEASN